MHVFEKTIGQKAAQARALEKALGQKYAQVRALEEAVGQKDAQARALEEAISQTKGLYDALLETFRQETDAHISLLARLKRKDYDGRLPSKLTGLRWLVPWRWKKLRQSAREYRVIAASPLFDADWYLANNPGVALGNVDPVLHYIRNGANEGLDPSPGFATTYYLAQNPDVANLKVNPLYHYEAHGRSEGRQLFHRALHPTQSGRLQLHASEAEYFIGDDDLLWAGYSEVMAKYKSRVRDQGPDPEALSFCVSFQDEELQGRIAALRLPKNTKNASVDISVVIPCLNQSFCTVEALHSIARAWDPELTYEIIIVDNGSTDPLFPTIARIPNLIYHRFETNTGFGNACNKGVELACGELVLFFNNDAQLAPGAAGALRGVLLSDNRIAIVGPKVLSFDGRLQEAGCILRSDGVGEFVGFGENHKQPRFNYRRRVDYVSGVAFMMRRLEFLDLGGFDESYAPAYCEDVDLCLRFRAAGKDIVYVPEALVAHHLSKTNNSGDMKHRLSVRNQQTLRNKWQAVLDDSGIRTIAFYLPQYHPIRENDFWWGKGFTEWRNVAKARPNYVGHRQPRYPADLGYYDLRLEQVMESQAELARRYGLYGFCYYYYWFDKKRLLEGPLERILATGHPDLPFCLCWANENWTRTWDGCENDILMAQNYTRENDLYFIEDISRYFRMPNYIRVGGKPLLLVYRVTELPDFASAAATWRDYCRREGLGEICLAMVESFQLSRNPENPAKYGCDLSIEFPPHDMVTDPPKPVITLNEKFSGQVNDYRALAYNYMTREEPGFKRIRSVLVGWDNTPRRQDSARVLENSSPGAFQAWLEWTIERTIQQNFGDDRMIFINAWNEWCEGSYLEPDFNYGHAYLQALRNSLDRWFH